MTFNAARVDDGRVKGSSVACCTLVCLFLLPGGSHARTILRPDMEEAIRTGIERNFELSAIRARSRAARLAERDAIIEYLPRPGLSVERSRAINEGETDSEFTEVRLNVDQVIYDGGARELNLGLARLERRLLGHEHNLNQNQTRLRIQEAFLSGLAARGKILLNRRSLLRAREQLRLARLEERTGFARAADVFRVTAQVSQIELALREAEDAYSAALDALKLEMNLVPETEIEPRGDLFRDFVFAPPTTLDLARLTANIRGTHPEILRARAEVYRARKEQEIAETGWIPRLALSGYVGQAGERFPVHNRTYGVNFQITLPFSIANASSAGSLDVAGNGTRRTGSSISQVGLLDDPGYSRRLLESRTQYARSRAQQNQTEHRTVTEVRGTYRAVVAGWKKISSGNHSVHLMDRSLKEAALGYRAGVSTRVDLLLAEIELVRFQTELTDALAAYLLAASALEVASGLDPGALRLYRYSPGRGNTLPARLLDEAASPPAGQAKSETIERPEPPDVRYEIDRIPLED